MPEGRVREQSRARRPDREGHVERDGVRVFYEVYGTAGPTVLFVPPWSIVHSRVWKLQIPYFARHGRVVVFDPRGNGRSDRPTEPAAYAEAEYALDALAVLDATGTDRACVVTLSLGAQRTLLLAAQHPSRVEGAVFISPALPLAPPHPARRLPFEDVLETDEGWAKYNAHYWARAYPDFVEFFIAQCANEPHSTKLVEDAVAWGLQTDSETLIASMRPQGLGEEDLRELCARVRCPVLVIHGNGDAITPSAVGVELAAATAGDLVIIEGGGHVLHARDPVRTNLLIRQFVRRVATNGRRMDPVARSV